MTQLAQAAQKLKIGQPGRHIFLCADQASAKCCSREAGLASWDSLKRRVEEINLHKGIQVAFDVIAAI